MSFGMSFLGIIDNLVNFLGYAASKQCLFFVNTYGQLYS